MEKRNLRFGEEKFFFGEEKIRKNQKNGFFRASKLIIETFIIRKKLILVRYIFIFGF